LDRREGSVRRNVERLAKAGGREGYRRLAEEAARKRLEWYERNGEGLNLRGSAVRRAYELLLIRYLGLDPEDVPVIYEDEERIVWRSSNFCPLLEACTRTGLDTRVVCREYQEVPAQRLIEKVDPNLRFSRSYEKIRPYASFCEEAIELGKPKATR